MYIIRLWIYFLCQKCADIPYRICIIKVNCLFLIKIWEIKVSYIILKISVAYVDFQYINDTIFFFLLKCFTFNLINEVGKNKIETKLFTKNKFWKYLENKEISWKFCRSKVAVFILSTRAQEVFYWNHIISSYSAMVTVYSLSCCVFFVTLRISRVL